MRKIKFRAWDEVNKEMVYPKIIKESFTALSSGDLLNRYEDVMQFTGLHDKHGREIYEGDVMAVPNYNYDPSNGDAPLELLLVGYANGGFTIGKHYAVEYGEAEREVIGNIHETPELL